MHANISMQILRKWPSGGVIIIRLHALGTSRNWAKSFLCIVSLISMTTQCSKPYLFPSFYRRNKYHLEKLGKLSPVLARIQAPSPGLSGSPSPLSHLFCSSLHFASLILNSWSKMKSEGCSPGERGFMLTGNSFDDFNIMKLRWQNRVLSGDTKSTAFLHKFFLRPLIPEKMLA
jgi:hypothetical protein